MAASGDKVERVCVIPHFLSLDVTGDYSMGFESKRFNFEGRKWSFAIQRDFARLVGVGYVIKVSAKHHEDYTSPCYLFSFAVVAGAQAWSEKTVLTSVGNHIQQDVELILTNEIKPNMLVDGALHVRCRIEKIDPFKQWPESNTPPMPSLPPDTLSKCMGLLLNSAEGRYSVFCRTLFMNSQRCHDCRRRPAFALLQGHVLTQDARDHRRRGSF